MAWYCRSFAVSSELEGKALWLECEGIDYIAEVWVNGRKVIRHEGGYTPFKARVGSLVRYGGENTLVVRVDSRHNSKTLPQGDGVNLAIDWPYTAGIFRPIRVLACPKEHLNDIWVSSFVAGRGPARVEVEVAVTHEDATPGAEAVHLFLTDPDGGEVAEKKVPLPTGDAIARASARFELASCAAWTPDTPNLYRLNAVLERTGGSATDSLSLRVGIRQIEIRDGEIWLNGEKLPLNGAGRVEYFPVLSRSLCGSVSRRDYFCLKEINGNSYRSAGYCPQISEVELADELGILIFCDIPCPKAQTPETEEALKDPLLISKGELMLREAIDQFKNNPSIFAWDLGTEMPVHTDQCYAYYRNGYRVAKSLDPTRPVFFVDNWGFYDPPRKMGKCGEFSDLIWVYIGYGWWVHGGDPGTSIAETDRVLELIHKTNPGKPLIVDFVGGHAIHGHPAEFEVMWTESYQAMFFERMFELLRSKSYVKGCQVWPLNEYRTLQSIVRAFYHYAGLYTVLRSPKQIVASVKKRYGQAA